MESIYHASIHIKCKIKYEWIDCRSLEKELQIISESSRYGFVCSKLSNMNAIIIPGGFGTTGIEGMIQCVNVARKLNIPTLGICLGLQVMVVEWLRNVCDIPDATSEEWNQISGSLNTKVIGLLKDQNINLLGGTMNLGSYNISLLNDSKIYNIYDKEIIRERHRHRYEVLPEYVDTLNKSGLIVSGTRDNIVETIELHNSVHKWYIGCQFHPEYESSIFHPHPLIMNWLLSSKSVLNSTNDIEIIGNGRYPIHSF